MLYKSFNDSFAFMIRSRYKKIRFIGSGAYSKVYEAIDRETNRKVALKISEARSTEGIPPTSLREIAVLKSIIHPNILKLLDVEYKDRKIILVFEYFDYDLKAYLNAHTVDVFPFIYQILLGLNHIHTKNVIHRDLKLQNILVNTEGHLKIGDFGLARSLELGLPHLSNEVVTLWYRSPELLKGMIMYDHSIDIWSFGCVVVEMISGKVLFPGRNIETQLELITTALHKGIRIVIAEILESVPDWLIDMICRCLEYDPKLRISASECLEIVSLNRSL